MDNWIEYRRATIEALAKHCKFEDPYNKQGTSKGKEIYWQAIVMEWQGNNTVRVVSVKDKDGRVLLTPNRSRGARKSILRP